MDSPNRLNATNNAGSQDLIYAPEHRPVVRVQPYSDVGVTAIEEPDDIGELIHYFWVLWKRKWVLVSAMIVGAILSIGVSLWMTPLYRAKASMEIQKSTQAFDNPGLAAADPSLQTHAQLLQSLT